MSKAPEYLNDLQSRVTFLCEQLREEQEASKRLPLLDELSFHLTLIDPRSGERYADEQLRSARSLDDRYWRMKGCIRLGNLVAVQSRYKEGRRLFEKALLLLEELPDDPTEKACVCRSMGKIEHETGNLRKGMELFEQSLDYARESGNKSEIGATLSEMGSLQTDMGFYSKGIEALNEALESHQTWSCMSGVGIELSKIGRIHGAIEDCESALHYYHQGLDLHRKVGNKHAEAQTCLEMGDLHVARGEYEIASELYDRALALFSDLCNPFRHGQACVSLARLCRLRGRGEEGLEYLGEGEKMFEAVENMVGRGQVLLERGENHLARKEWEDAIASLTKALRIADEAGLQPVLIRIHKVLAHAYEGNQNPAESLNHYKLFMELEKKILNADVQGVVLAHRYNGQIENIQSEKECYRRRTMQLEEKAETYSKELASLSDSMSEHNTLLDQLRERLVALKHANGHTSSSISAMIREIDDRVGRVDAWNTFERQLQTLDQQFLHTLTTTYPFLTPAEIRICSLLKVNMSNKEIAALLNLSDQTIDTHRKRIRKKMGLGRDVNLVTMLGSL